MRTLRRVRSTTRRLLLGILMFLALTAVCSIPVGILGSSNLVWGEPNQYGRIDVPATKVMHLPSGDMIASIAVYFPQRAAQSVVLPIPSSLTLQITPVSGTGHVTLSKSFGSTDNSLDGADNTLRRVWNVHVPSSGDYRVTTAGNFAIIGAVNAQIWFGHGPPIPGVAVPFIGMGGAVLILGFWEVSSRLRHRRPSAATVR